MGGPGSGRLTKEEAARREAERIERGEEPRKKGNQGRYPRGSKAGPVGTEGHDSIVRFNKFQTRIRHLPKIDTTDTEQIYQRYEEYVQLSSEMGVEQTMGLFAKALGTGYPQLSGIMRGTVKSEKWPEESIEAVRDIGEYIEAFAELCLLDPENRNAAQRIFYLKNRHAWRDAREELKVVEQRGIAPANDKQLEELAQRYLMQAGVVEVEAEVSDES